MIMKLHIITIILIQYSILSIAQDNNLIKNGDFEKGNFNDTAKFCYNFKYNLKNWKCRTKQLHNGQWWHSPDWVYYYLNPNPISGDGYVFFQIMN
ncbi:MAG: hypothetical protein ACP5DZ_10150 [Bacteroidales bacterium]